MTLSDKVFITQPIEQIGKISFKVYSVFDNFWCWKFDFVKQFTFKHSTLYVLWFGCISCELSAIISCRTLSILSTHSQPETQRGWWSVVNINENGEAQTGITLGKAFANQGCDWNEEKVWCYCYRLQLIIIYMKMTILSTKLQLLVVIFIVLIILREFLSNDHIINPDTCDTFPLDSVPTMLRNFVIRVWST